MSLLCRRCGRNQVSSISAEFSGKIECGACQEIELYGSIHGPVEREETSIQYTEEDRKRDEAEDEDRYQHSQGF